MRPVEKESGETRSPLLALTGKREGSTKKSWSNLLVKVNKLNALAPSTRKRREVEPKRESVQRRWG